MFGSLQIMTFVGLLATEVNDMLKVSTLSVIDSVVSTLPTVLQPPSLITFHLRWLRRLSYDDPLTALLDDCRVTTSGCSNPMLLVNGTKQTL